MKKPIFTACVTLFLSFLTPKAEASDIMVLHHVSGARITFPLDDSPIISFDGGSMMVGNRLFAVSEISKYTIEDEAGIIPFNTPDFLLRITDEGEVIVNTVVNSDEVRIFDVNGIELPCALSSYNGITVINLSAYPGGIYVLSIGSYNFKIHKK